MIASHYAEPAARILAGAAALRSRPSTDADIAAELSKGDSFLMLDDSLGWAWGYGGDERRVGYVPTEALAEHRNL